MPIQDYEGYTDPDEENPTEDQTVDPVWELQQKKTFTAWCNAHLRKVNATIEEIDKDFRDGLRLMKLLEVISGDFLPKPDKGKMRFHKIANVNKALDFIISKGVKLVSIGAEEIVDGNVKMTLGMIWTIILRFTIQDIQIEDSSAKEGLLLWCQRQTAPYSNVNVQNFHMSFKDGLAFCALIHRHFPELIDYDKLSKQNPMENLNRAFDVAEKHLDIPRMLDAEDMVNSVKPDERSVMTYVSSYYHKMAGANKASLAANHVTNVLRSTRENDRLVDEYETLSSSLLEWIAEKLKQFSSREPLTTVPDAEALQAKSRVYRREEKPQKLQDKAQLETTYNTIQTRLRLNNRPPYVPAADKYLSEISNKWNELEETDKAYDEWLYAEHERLRRVDYLINKFNIRCTTHEAWAKDKPDMLKCPTDLENTSLPVIRAKMKIHEAFRSELEANEDRVDRIRALAEELGKLQYHDMNAVNARYEAIVNTTGELKRLSEEREFELTRISELLEQIDQLHLDFAKRAAPFRNWMEQTEEDLRDTPIIHSMPEVQRYVAAHQGFEGTLTGTEQELDAIQECAKKVDRLVQENKFTSLATNPYTTIQLDELRTRWDVIKELSSKRSEYLKSEEQRQHNNDELCRQFADKAMQLDAWLQDKKSAVNMSALEGHGSLENQLSQVRQLEEEVENQRSNLESLEQCSQALEDAYVFDNPFTTLSMPSLRVAYDQLQTSLKYTANEIGNQKLTRDSKGLSSEQMADLRNVFKHFDRDESGRLSPPEFKACLVSLGHVFTEDQRGLSSAINPMSDDSDFAHVMEQVDPGHTGSVTFDAFLNFMTRENADNDTAEQIMQSFKAMAGDKGYVTADDIRRYLSPEDAEYCIKRMLPMSGPTGDSGALNYEQFAKEIYGS